MSDFSSKSKFPVKLCSTINLFNGILSWLKDLCLKKNWWDVKQPIRSSVGKHWTAPVIWITHQTAFDSQSQHRCRVQQITEWWVTACLILIGASDAPSEPTHLDDFHCTNNWNTASITGLQHKTQALDVMNKVCWELACVHRHILPTAITKPICTMQTFPVFQE